MEDRTSEMWRGHEIAVIDSQDGPLLEITGEECPHVHTDAGFRVAYGAPAPTLEEAARDFLDTQPEATSMTRRGFTELKAPERKRLGLALSEVFESGLIESNAALHAQYFWGGIHWGPAFLPWHRDFLRKLELALQAIDDTLMLPYWDWTRADSRELDAEPWLAFFGGRDVAGGLFDGWGFTRNSDDGGNVLPVVAPGTPKAIVVPEELHVETFSELRQLETGSHVPGHTWTGGTMASGSSPLDPLFYLHHCNLDRLWAIWQMNHPEAEQYSLDAVPGDSVEEARVPLNDPMVDGATPASMLDHTALGYRYPRDAALEQAWADAGYGDLITAG